MMEKDLQNLLPLLQRGEPGAVAAMMDAYGDRLLRAAFFFCRDKNEAQDLVQETFCRAIPALPRFRGECILYTWLYGILRNLYFSHARRQRRYFFWNDMPQPAAAESDPEQTAERQEKNDRVDWALKDLPAKHREILLLRFGEEMKLNEIAAMLDITPGTVKSRLHHALKRLRKRLGPDGLPHPGREAKHEM